MGMITYAKYKKLKTSIYEMIKDVQHPAVKAIMADALMMKHQELSDGILLKKLSENPTLFIK